MPPFSQPDSTRVVRAFVRLGWKVDHVAGSHHIPRRGNGPTLSIPVHKGRPMKSGTFRGLLRAAGVSLEDFARNY